MDYKNPLSWKYGHQYLDSQNIDTCWLHINKPSIENLVIFTSSFFSSLLVIGKFQKHLMFPILNLECGFLFGGISPLQGCLKGGVMLRLTGSFLMNFSCSLSDDHP
jgi:hypothetical protein